MKRIIIKSLSPFKIRCPATIYSDLRGVNSSLCIGYFCTKNVKLSKIMQDVYNNRTSTTTKFTANSNNSVTHLLSVPYLLISYRFVGLDRVYSIMLLIAAIAAPSEIIQGTAYCFINFPICSVPKNRFEFVLIAYVSFCFLLYNKKCVCP